MSILMIVLALVVLGIVVFFHELGHFIAAKKVGIRVYTFSIGFGPRLWGFKKDDTDYRISAIPFGGYVAMAGEEIADRKGESNEFASKTPFERFCVAFAGPFMNFVLAAVLIWVVTLVGEREPAYLSNMVVGVVQQGSLADTAGIQMGDTLISLNGKKITDWDRFLKKVMLSKKSISLTYAREGKEYTKELTLVRDTMTGAVNLGLFPGFNPIIGEVMENSPAKNAGLLPDDTITAIGGKKISCWEEVATTLNEVYVKDKEITIEVLRNGTAMTVLLIPGINADGKPMLGVTVKMEERLIRSSFIDSFGATATRYWSMVQDMWTAIALLVSNTISIKTMAGPIGIVQMTSKVAQFGLTSLFIFIAFISINLGIVNLLPIPITDGGQIVFVILEKIMGKPLNKKTMAMMMNVAFYMLIALALFVTYNDILRIFKK